MILLFFAPRLRAERTNSRSRSAIVWARVMRASGAMDRTPSVTMISHGRVILQNQIVSFRSSRRYTMSNANKSGGNAKRLSTMMLTTRSTRPLKYPPSMPMSPPKNRPMIVAPTPMSNVNLAPYTHLESTSKLLLSVPSQARAPGPNPYALARSAIFIFSSYLVMNGNW